MESIFTAFYLADAYIESSNSGNFDHYTSPDSMHVYRPILEKHGYSDTAFQLSMDYYLHHPKELTRIFKHVRIRLEKEADRPLALVDDAEDIVSEEEVTEEAVDIHEGSEPAIEKKEPGVKPAPDRNELKKPVRKESKRKRMSKDDLKRLEEELRK